MKVGGQRQAPAALTPGKISIHVLEAGFDPRTVQPVASRYTDYAVPTLNNNSTNRSLRYEIITVA
jgi:hypothetical protein